jgi:hypothetical protein
MRRQLVIGALVVLETASAVLAWRDLDRRADTEVRGSKKFWKALVVVNPGNSMLYWLIGRRAARSAG